jgi:hypothetical protein
MTGDWPAVLRYRPRRPLVALAAGVVLVAALRWAWRCW